MNYTVDDALNVNPFEGDFGDGEILLGDSIVKAKKNHMSKCHCCGGDIMKNDRHRARREVYDKKAVTTRWCALCCIAMAISSEDCGLYWETRVNLHRI